MSDTTYRYFKTYLERIQASKYSAVKNRLTTFREQKDKVIYGNVRRGLWYIRGHVVSPHRGGA